MASISTPTKEDEQTSPDQKNLYDCIGGKLKRSTGCLTKIDTLHTILFTVYKIKTKGSLLLDSMKNGFKKIQLEHTVNMATVKSKTGRQSPLQIMKDPL